MNEEKIENLSCPECGGKVKIYPQSQCPECDDLELIKCKCYGCGITFYLDPKGPGCDEEDDEL